MRDLTRLFAKTMQTALPMALVGMLSLCVACTKLSPAERAFVKQYEKDNSGEKVVKIVLRPFEGEGKYKGRFTARFKKHGSMKEYEQGVHLIYAHGDCYYETFSSATTVSGATALGNITAIGNGTVSRDTSCDDLWPFSVSDEADDAHEDFLEYLDSQRKLANNLRSGRNPATGEASWKIRTRDQKLSDAMQQRRLESIFFRSFDPKYYEEHIDEVEEAYRQIAGNGMSRRSAGFYTNGLELSRGGLDVGFADLVASNLREPGDKFEVGGGLYMKDGTMMKPAARFNPADVDVARFRALVQYEQKRYADEMAKVAANVADWDNFIKNAPNSISTSYARPASAADLLLSPEPELRHVQRYRDAAEDNLRREHEIRMAALAASPAAARLSTANAVALYHDLTGRNFTEDYADDVFKAEDFGSTFERAMDAAAFAGEFFADNEAGDFLKDKDGLFYAKPGSDLWKWGPEEAGRFIQDWGPHLSAPQADIITIEEVAP